MRHRRILKIWAGIALLGGVITVGFFTGEMWLPDSPPTSSTDKGAGKHSPVSGGELLQVKLTPHAQGNLRLVVKPLKADTFWRTIQLPGMVVDRPAYSDRGIVAPVTAVVKRVHYFPGDTVRPGDTLFTLRLLSETIHLAQSDLFKTSKELQILEEKKKRLTALFATGTLPEVTLLENEYQLRRQTVAAQAYRAELLSRGLTPEQIAGVAEGKYVSEIEVKAPQNRSPDKELLSGLLAKQPAAQANDDPGPSPSFEVQELKVELGQQVQAGQTLGLLSNHQSLYIEGRAFRQETSLVETATKQGWPIQVDFMEEEPSDWPPLDQSFTIRHVANTIDTASRTFAFFMPLNNQSRNFKKDGRTLILWRFRPGQKVRLLVRVEKFANVFVLPADAVVREGPEAYVFRQNGDLFDRKPVRIVHQDRQHVVIANDGSIPPGLFVVQNGATQLNRALKAQSASAPSGVHVHADGSVHTNH